MRARLAWALSLAVALALGSVVYAQAPAMTVISDIRQEGAGDSTRLVVVSNGPLTYTYYSPDPLTLIIDVPDVDVSKLASRLNIGTAEVESLRVTPMTRGEGRSLARFEVRMTHRAPYSIYSKENTLNLVFERSGEAVSASAEPAAPPAAAASTEPHAAEAKPAVETKTADAKADPAVAPPAPARKVLKASHILGVDHSEEDGQLAVTIRADGHVRYQDFYLGNPDRLVVDLRDVSSGPGKVMEVGSEPVRRMRLAQFSAGSPKVARLVLELSRRAPYRLVEATDGLKIVFGDGPAPHTAPLAAMRVSEPEASVPVMVASASTSAAPMPAALSVPANLNAPPTLAVPVPMAAPIEVPGMGAESFEAKTVSGADKKFTGHPISLDFKDGDLQDIFRLFSDISGLNIVVNPGVSGKVTLVLKEVPWDQALDLILKTNNLGYTLDDNVIRIAKLSDLQREEQERRKLDEEKALAGQLQVWRKPLSYAKGSDMLDTVKKVALSARGSIIIDARTNTMIITDLPSFIEKAKDLILDLDRATPQVEIEARIVVTTRNFERDLGVQWGFLNQQTPQLGNTTSYAFPHSIILNGGGVPNSTTGGGLSPEQVGGLATAAGIGPSGRGYAVNLPAAAVNSALGVSLGNILGSFNLDAALTALESRGRGRILSTPKVTTQNNQAAEIKQGVQVPVQTFSASTGPSVTFKDAFLILKVTPQITDAGTVILNLEVENNSPDFANAVQGNPPINVQSAKTNVLVKDGATAVIGGIYQSRESVSRASTPFLGDLPILGYLFRNKAASSSNSELILFITPRIVKS
jgi:type IV pilus secretin PilQ/predicted competence protein